MLQHRDANKQKWRSPMVCGILLLLTLAVYGPVAENDFINLDDDLYVINNNEVNRGLSREGIHWAFTSTQYMGNWHPLTWISHQVDCQFHSLNPRGHHLTSLLLHCANVLLLLAVLTQMTGAVWPSAFVAALFAWHPTHVESVAWISERKDVLSAFFWLLTMLAYVKYAQCLELKVRSSRTGIYYSLALASFVFGLMSKPMVVTLPIVLLLMDYWPLKRIGECGMRSAELQEGEGETNKQNRTVSWRRVVWEKAPFALLSFISCLVTFLAQKEAGAVQSLSQLSILKRVVLAVVSYCRYLGKTLWPRHLSAFYPPTGGWPKAIELGAAIGLAVASVAVFRARRRSPYLCVGWLWFLVTLVPVIGLVQVGSQSLADRYTYLPTIGLFIMIAWGARQLGADRPMRSAILGLTGAVILGACLALTWRWVQDWRNSGTLFRQSLEAAPVNNYVAHACLGRYLGDQGRNAEAIEHFRAALDIGPTYYPAQYGIGWALVAEGRWQEAAEHLSEGIKIFPGFAEGQAQLGLALSKLGRKDEAIEHYRAAVQLNPWLIESWLKLADLLAETGRIQEAGSAAVRARDMAIATGQRDVVEAVGKRLESYRAGKPYDEKQ